VIQSDRDQLLATAGGAFALSLGAYTVALLRKREMYRLSPYRSREPEYEYGREEHRIERMVGQVVDMHLERVSREWRRQDSRFDELQRTLAGQGYLELRTILSSFRTTLSQVNSRLEQYQTEMTSLVLAQRTTSFAVSVYLDTTEKQHIDSLVGALREIMGEQGLTMQMVYGPEYSSWYARFKLAITNRDPDVRDEFAYRLQKVEHAIEVRMLQEPMSVVNINQADAVSRLLNAVSAIPNAVLLVSSVIVVKLTNNDGKEQVFVKTLSVAEVRAFEANQHLLKSPREALEHLHLLGRNGSEPARPEPESASTQP
jgi:hypothetical protein